MLRALRASVHKCRGRVLSFKLNHQLMSASPSFLTLSAAFATLNPLRSFAPSHQIMAFPSSSSSSSAAAATTPRSLLLVHHQRLYSTQRIHNSHHGAFAVLRIAKPDEVSEAELKKAYREAAFRTHPDQGGTAAAFRAATDAYEECLRFVLSKQHGTNRHSHHRTRAPTDEERAQSDHEKWKLAMDLLIKNADFERAWGLWNSRIYDSQTGYVTLDLVEVGLKLCAATELREALGLLADIEGRDMFVDDDQRVACYNSLLWHCHMHGNQGDMDLILEILRVMDRKSLQPDLGLLDMEIFTFFPRSH